MKFARLLNDECKFSEATNQQLIHNFIFNFYLIDLFEVTKRNYIILFDKTNSTTLSTYLDKRTCLQAGSHDVKAFDSMA